MRYQQNLRELYPRALSRYASLESVTDVDILPSFVFTLLRKQGLNHYKDGEANGESAEASSKNSELY